MISLTHPMKIQRDGFTVVENGLDSASLAHWISELESLFASDLAAIKNRRGAVYAARNILSSLPECCDISRLGQLTDLLTETLGPDFGLVRGLYFDKHPDRTWSLPWHKDLTIAVKDNSISSTQFTKPTNKSGVAHVEAPESVLRNMLTLRIHLDPVTEENGPLEVAVGSHANGKQPGSAHTVKKSTVQDSSPGAAVQDAVQECIGVDVHERCTELVATERQLVSRGRNQPSAETKTTLPGDMQVASRRGGVVGVESRKNL